MNIANVDMAKAWDGPEGDHWAEHAERYEATTGGRYWEALMRAVPIEAGHSVLDVGCGTGRSTREVARVASSGSALGIDLSSRMLDRARAVAEDEGLTNVRFEQADAQVHPFPDAAFDLAVSSFGCMFFADPVAAFANLGRSLKGDGGMALLAWRDVDRNDWVASVLDALSLDRTPPRPPVGVPGPFAFADRGHVERVMKEAGFVDVGFDEIDEPMWFGADGDDAYSFVSTLGVTRGMTHDLEEADRTAALDALRQALVDHETDAGVVFAGSAWLITARTGGRARPT